ncbi:MAG: PIN domain-containing protein [Candidatus Saganbacteria bacterium]|nr:PIN domain-containing protein [Candidatus Saganbacteria bacterium]
MRAKLIKENSLVALDTALFIYHFEKENNFFPVTSFVFEQIESGRISAVTTVISLAEILVKPMQLGSVQAIEDYQIILNNFPHLTILNIDQKLTFVAAELRASYGVKLPDALQIAGGLVSGANIFLTNDKKLKKVKEIKVITLSELL